MSRQPVSMQRVKRRGGGRHGFHGSVSSRPGGVGKGFLEEVMDD